MNWSFVRREWGAVTFVLTVLLGAIVVPLAFLLGNHTTGAAGAINAPAATSARTATAAREATPSQSP